ncbi:MAG: hypothetical protein JWO50_541 [Candidatus Kaiserbacteria bacterium]|nr:hypothetical protein [Candidatus Kaiserbacteria bacterium]
MRVILYYVPVLILFFIAAHGVHAETTAGNLTNPIKVTSVSDFLKSIFTVITRLGVIVISVAIVFVGFKFIVAQGNPEALKSARRNALYVFIGAAIVLGAEVITAVLSDTANKLLS